MNRSDDVRISGAHGSFGSTLVRSGHEGSPGETKVVRAAKSPLRPTDPVFLCLATNDAHPLSPLLVVMRARGWQVEVAPIERVVARVVLRPPTVVLVDQGVRAPSLAFSAARQVRCGYPGPIVVLTSLGLPAVTEEARTAACTCVTTPCRPQHVVRCVSSALAMADRRWTRRSPGIRKTVVNEGALDPTEGGLP